MKQIIAAALLTVAVLFMACDDDPSKPEEEIPEKKKELVFQEEDSSVFQILEISAGEGMPGDTISIRTNRNPYNFITFIYVGGQRANIIGHDYNWIDFIVPEFKSITDTLEIGESKLILPILVKFSTKSDGNIFDTLENIFELILIKEAINFHVFPTKIYRKGKISINLGLDLGTYIYASDFRCFIDDVELEYIGYDNGAICRIPPKASTGRLSVYYKGKYQGESSEIINIYDEEFIPSRVKIEADGIQYVYSFTKKDLFGKDTVIYGKSGFQISYELSTSCPFDRPEDWYQTGYVFKYCHQLYPEEDLFIMCQNNFKKDYLEIKSDLMQGNIIDNLEFRYVKEYSYDLGGHSKGAYWDNEMIKLMDLKFIDDGNMKYFEAHGEEIFNHVVEIFEEHGSNQSVFSSNYVKFEHLDNIHPDAKLRIELYP